MSLVSALEPSLLVQNFPDEIIRELAAFKGEVKEVIWLPAITIPIIMCSS